MFTSHLFSNEIGVSQPMKERKKEEQALRQFYTFTQCTKWPRALVCMFLFSRDDYCHISSFWDLFYGPSRFWPQ